MRISKEFGIEGFHEFLTYIIAFQSSDGHLYFIH